MSLINQMLRDLEQRRTAEASSSPLGGLSPSGTATQSMQFSINYKTLAMLVGVLFVVGVITAYLLGSQQSAVIDEGGSIVPVEKSVSMVVEEVQASQAMQLVSSIDKRTASDESIAEKENSQAQVKQSEAVVVAKNPDAKTLPVAVVVQKQTKPTKKVAAKAAPVVIKPAEARVVTEPRVESEEKINKTVRPLTEEQQAQLAFQRAVKLLGQGRQQVAQTALLESLSFLPTHIQARETLAALLLNNGQVSEAASSLREALQLTPSATPLAKLYARILVDQGDVAEALLVLERARPAVAADPEYYALMAALYGQQKKHAQAAVIYQQILLQRPGVASWWMGLALAQDAMGEKAKALDAFQRAQRAGGLNAQVLAYVQSRITALTPVTLPKSSHMDELED